jgi:hypothetical protein
MRGLLVMLAGEDDRIDGGGTDIGGGRPIAKREKRGDY